MEAKCNFYTLEEIRERLFGGKISRSHLYVMVREGKIEARRFGRKILIPVAVAEKLLTEGVK